MFEDIGAWILVLGSIAAYAALWAIPQTRPYAKKYGWILIIVAVAAAGYALLRRRPGNSIDDSIAEGDEMVERNSHVLDQMADAAHEAKLKNDAQHKRKLIKAEEDTKEFDAKLEAIETVEDSMARRRALVKLVESS